MTSVDALGRQHVVSADEFILPPRYSSPSIRTQLVVKRCCDVLLSALGLVLLFPVLGLIALAILCTSGGPVLYPWRVVGLRGRFFTGYKFRTMVRDAEAQLARLQQRNEMTGPVFKMKDDPRVTPIGRVLRRMSLDELPQLWSVFIGDMSLVGPRPPLRTEWERFSPWQRRKLSVTPGITCLWQSSGRSNIANFDEWVRMDIDYINRWSLALDVTILFRTVGAVFLARGAH